MEHYLSTLQNIETFVERFKNDIYEAWFKEEKEETIGPLYLLTGQQRKYFELLCNIVDVSEFFGIRVLDANRKNFERSWLSYIEDIPEDTKWEEVNAVFARITHVFRMAKEELTEKINLLEEEERERLNEAFNCYIQELNYSAIVMSVSAIENRLFSLMSSKCHGKKLEELTLGQLIWEYTHNKEKYGNIIPEKHEPLLDYCNIYRVFSVHPKKEKINRSNATTILCMSCSFLFDKNMKIKIV